MTEKEALKILYTAETPDSRMEEAIDMAISALEAADKYRWHDLRKDPKDLPTEKGWVECWLYIKGVIDYSMDLYFNPENNTFKDNRRKNVFEMYEVLAFNSMDSYRKNKYILMICATER